MARNSVVPGGIEGEGSAAAPWVSGGRCLSRGRPWRRRSRVDRLSRGRPWRSGGSGGRCLSRGRPWCCRYRMDPAYREVDDRGRAGLGARPPASRVEGLPSWAHAALCEGGLRRDAPGGCCLSRDPSTLPVTGGAAASANRRSPDRDRAAHRERGPRRRSDPRGPTRGRSVDVARRRLPPRRANEGLRTNSRTLAFSCGRRILHAKAGKIR